MQISIIQRAFKHLWKNFFSKRPKNWLIYSVFKAQHHVAFQFLFWFFSKKRIKKKHTLKRQTRNPPNNKDLKYYSRSWNVQSNCGNCQIPHIPSRVQHIRTLENFRIRVGKPHLYQNSPQEWQFTGERTLIFTSHYISKLRQRELLRSK